MLELLAHTKVQPYVVSAKQNEIDPRDGAEKSCIAHNQTVHWFIYKKNISKINQQNFPQHTFFFFFK